MKYKIINPAISCFITLLIFFPIYHIYGEAYNTNIREIYHIISSCFLCGVFSIICFIVGMESNICIGTIFNTIFCLSWECIIQPMNRYKMLHRVFFQYYQICCDLIGVVIFLFIFYLLKRNFLPSFTYNYVIKQNNNANNRN